LVRHRSGRTGSALEWDGNDDGNMNTKSTTSTIITGLSRNTTYYFKIWAIDSFTNEATVADATDTTEPAACPICQKYSPLAAGYRLITDCYGGNDSDDNNAGTYPTEICDNGIDDNSNNLIDCADTSACPTGTSCGTNKQCEDSLCYAGLDYMEYANDAAAQAAYVTSVAWLSGYSTRKKLTIDHNKIDSALSNFPVLVKLTSSNFDFSKANNDGFDIRFTSSNGTTLLKYEREQHDSSGQKAEYWVKIPSISADVNTDFYIYYRTTDTADGAEPSNVWDSNFQGVYHMTNLNDSSGYGRNGSAVGSITQAEGKIYKSQYDNATYGSRINLGSGSHWALGTMTLEIYGNMTGGDTYICKDWGTGYALYMDGSNHAVMTLTDQANGRKVTGTTDVKNNFHYIAGTYDGTTIKLFVNGVSEGTPYNYGFTYSGSAELYIGGNNFGGGGIGYWDEVRISNISRGSAWIKASYHSENDSLLTYGKDTPLQSYSESSIKQQGSYSLKGIALGTDSLNDTLTRTVSPTIDLSNKNTIKFDIRASRTGSNIKIGIHDSGGTTTEITPNIISANTWQTVEWDISGVSNANKDAIDQIKITITNADSDNTFYIDNMRAH